MAAAAEICADDGAGAGPAAVDWETVLIARWRDGAGVACLARDFDVPESVVMALIRKAIRDRAARLEDFGEVRSDAYPTRERDQAAENDDAGHVAAVLALGGFRAMVVPPAKRVIFARGAS